MSIHVSCSNFNEYGLSPYSDLPLTVDAAGAMDQRVWFAIYTKSHHEKSVARQLSQKGIDHYLPLYKTKHSWSHGRRMCLDLPLFPNYLFVHIPQSERARVLQTEGVVMFVDRGDALAPIRDREIELLRAELHLRKPEPEPKVLIGQKARIVTGALAGIEGIVLRRKGELRLIITVPLIHQCVAVEVDASQVVGIEPLLCRVLKCCPAAQSGTRSGLWCSCEAEGIAEFG